jgi:hypothetical protein
MEHKVLARATIRDCRIEGSQSFGLKVDKTSLIVNRSIPLWLRYRQGKYCAGELVDVRVRHLLLDPGTSNERHVWDAQVLGDIKE